MATLLRYRKRIAIPLSPRTGTEAYGFELGCEMVTREDVQLAKCGELSRHHVSQLDHGFRH